jgi:hypothetical protein
VSRPHGLGTPHLLYGERKRKRHLYLTDTAHQHLVGMAQRTGNSPSEVCEQIIRKHANAAAAERLTSPFLIDILP